ncbi:UvrD-helicase domain-containing protein [Pseudomonas orientalis]|uniref:UvrD-helicase domain-containing protein n=1 Tax=Pseudomonas orientalis TaxID=76758 RepID=UPI0034D5BAAB
MDEFNATPEQQAIIDADLRPLSVVACPGSGKTATAVRRLAEVRNRMTGTRGNAALLSFSNVAVDTFRTEYQQLRGRDSTSDRVVIQTMDSFITMFVLRPHGARIMKASRTPFLVLGGEPFLANYRFGDDKKPIGIEDIVLDRENGKTILYRKHRNGGWSRLDDENSELARIKIAALAKVGGYTHAVGRAWALALLRKEPRLTSALARKFPQILVDEAQDIGSLEGEILDLLMAAGAVVSLIGDVHQSIYGFNFATGAYLRDYATRPGVLSHSLTQNRRSLPCVVSVANSLALSCTQPYRKTVSRLSGVYYCRYDVEQLPQLIADWGAGLRTAGYQLIEASILCRGASLLSRLSSETVEMGQSAVKHFAAAASVRDQGGGIAKVLDHCAKGVLHIVHGLPVTFVQDIKGMRMNGEMNTIRRLIWKLIKSPDKGIPLASLSAKSQWLPQLKTNLAGWLDQLEKQTSLKRIPTWAARIKSTKLSSTGPLLTVDLGNNEWAGLRCGTVHSAKGEGITAVMYLTTKKDLESMLAGTDGEEGRIGFVAVTRARDLLVIAIPMDTTATTVQSLVSKGFSDWETRSQRDSSAATLVETESFSSLVNASRTA